MKKRLLAVLISLSMLGTSVSAIAAEDFVTEGDYEAQQEEGSESEEDFIIDVQEGEPSENSSDNISYDEDTQAQDEQESEEPVYEEEVTEEDYYTEEDLIEEDADEVFYGEYLDEEEYLEAMDLTINEDGMYEAVDRKGTVWYYDPEDPEIFRHFVSDEPKIGLDMLDESEEELLTADGVDNPDPYVFKLNKNLKYAYPKHYKTSKDEERVAVRYGIDVSKYQKDISLNSWKKLKDTYGIEFAFIRVGFRGWGQAGVLKIDECYENNIERAYEAGLKVGVYFFSQAITIEEAEEEAQLCIDSIEKYKEKIELPVIIDYEYAGSATEQGRLEKARLTAKGQTEIVNAFCTKARDAGYLAGVYANKSMLQDDLRISEIDSENYIWMANFATAGDDGITRTTYSQRLNAWQFTSKFTGFSSFITGTTEVDLSFWYGNFPGEKQSKPAPDPEPEPDPVYYDVTFDSLGGSTVASETVLENDPVTKPADPTKEGYIFCGWYRDKYGMYAWDFENYKVTRDMTLYAYWEFDSDLNWGDLANPDNADIKALYTSPSQVPEEIKVYGVEDEVDYTGSPIVFENLRVFYGKKQLIQGSDFTLKYLSNTKAGTAKIKVTGKGNYASTQVIEFTIKALDITGMLIAPDVSLSYTGKVQKAKTTVSYKCSEDELVVLKEGTDFTFVYPGTDKKAEGYYKTAFVGNKDADTAYTVSIVARGNYTGEATFTETILKKESEEIPVSKLKISAIKPQTLSFDGSGNVIAAEPSVTVKYNGKPVEKDAADGYQIEYKNNTAAGKGYAYITGTGCYVGTRRVEFTISPYRMNKVKVVGIKTDNNYTGGKVTQDAYQLSTTVDGKDFVLVEGRDYVVSYANNVNATKAARISFTGIGAFSGTLKKTYAIKVIPFMVEGKANTNLDFTVDEAVAYTKNGTKADVSIVYKGGDYDFALVPGKDYTLRYTNINKVNAGTMDLTPAVTITGKGNFSGKIKFFYDITKENLGNLRITATDVVYENKADICKPKIKIYDSNGAALSPGTDYSPKIVYTYAETKKAVDKKKIINAGTEIIATVTGQGCFEGKAKVTFSFVTKSIEGAKVKVKNQYYTGKKVKITKDDIQSIKLAGVSLKPEDYEIDETSYFRNVEKGTATVTLVGTGNYGGFQDITFKIVGRPVSNQ